MAKFKNSRLMRVIRHKRVRQRVRGTSSRPRLALFRSLNHIYAQVIDDSQGFTLVSASSLDAEFRSDGDSHTKGKASTMVGSLLAKRAKEKGIKQVVFDAGGFKYHGRVRAFAEAAREAGLEF